MPKPGIIQYEKILVNGAEVKASAPVVISASRATDIPAFHGDWFKKQLEVGYVKRRNPFSGKDYYISLKNAAAYVFWTKNPEPFYAFLTDFDRDFYIHFTLNNYDGTGLEPNVPDVDTRIHTFRKFAATYGKERILWRFDPIVLLPGERAENVIERISYVADQLKSFTQRLTFSFLTLNQYTAARRRLAQHFPDFNGELHRLIPDAEEQYKILKYFALLQKEWQNQDPNFSVQACAMDFDYAAFEIKSARCVDDGLLAKLFPHNEKLMEFLGRNNLFSKSGSLPDDKSQRKHCHCIPSKDIGAYNTCKHNCLYCYANKVIKKKASDLQKLSK